MNEASPYTLAPIATVGEAEHAIANLNKIMDRLMETVEEETAHVRAGRLRDTVELDEAKVELARHYMAESERVKSAKDLIAQSLPEALDRLRKRHDAFQALLQKNLTVLATAHAVSEGIIRGVSGELERKRTPQTYNASGRETHPSPRTAQPLALSLKL